MSFLKNKKGQTTVEYLLIIMVIVVVIGVLGKTMSTRIREVTDKVFNNINKKIDTLMGASGG
ncbi:MAG: class III signal peptide-containing protein [Deltaproteobacteria bacterium]|nr:class III signal peptide-containing protein [Deltaproteobacteria bacterium]